jgi:hypothetical protein
VRIKIGKTDIEPTFAGFPMVSGEDRAFECLEQQQFALAASKGRSRPAVDGTQR